MKVFEFDPVTGRRGAQIDNVRRAAWTSEYDADYAGATPVGFGKDADVTVHRDAGITSADGATDISYKRDRWITFCLGCWHMGPGEDRWQWIVLAPRAE